ncbi:MAG: RHS repeat domain-containing protein [Chryseobacterium culicis]
MSFGKNSTGVLEIVDSNDYYPFGMNHLKTGNVYFGQDSFKKYKYNGKELQETGMYDYGARFYMQDLGRWGVVDPLAEKMRRWSPYTYAFNNPLGLLILMEEKQQTGIVTRRQVIMYGKIPISKLQAMNI